MLRKFFKDEGGSVNSWSYSVGVLFIDLVLKFQIILWYFFEGVYKSYPLNTNSIVSLRLSLFFEECKRRVNHSTARQNGINSNITAEQSVADSKSESNEEHNECNIETQVLSLTTSEGPRVTALRSNADPIVQQNKQRRVIKMLFVVVLEFFICWTPIYTINTITLYNPRVRLKY